MTTGSDPEDLGDKKMYTSRSSACPQLAEVIDNTDNNDPKRSHNGNGGDDDRMYVTPAVASC